jgi:hypothetical protein
VSLVLCATAAAAWTGLLAGMAALWSGGALGNGALAVTGPPVGWTALAAFVWTGAVATPTAFALRWYRARAAARPDVAGEPDQADLYADYVDYADPADPYAALYAGLDVDHRADPYVDRGGDVQGFQGLEGVRPTDPGPAAGHLPEPARAGRWWRWAQASK